MPETLAPWEYAQFRPVPDGVSGFQSYRYRASEFLLNNKDEAQLPVHVWLEGILRAPSIHDEFLRYLARRGFTVPAACVECDFA